MKIASGVALALASLGGAIGVGVVFALSQQQSRQPLPSATWQTYSGSYTEADVEAGARMVASENPGGSQRLHIEQVYTQLRARRRGEGLFERITAGSGWGQQGEGREPGGIRPVSTDKPATDEGRALVREILDGLHSSEFRGARKFFEPKQSDLAFAIGERARAKQLRGEKLTKQEQRLLKYRKSADQVRKEWLGDGSRFVTRIDGVEFFT